MVRVRLASRPATIAREYLRRANGCLRKSVMALACIHRVMATPVADAASYGRPLADSLGLRSATDAVREVLYQDRSLATWIARDCLVVLDTVLGTMCMSFAQALDMTMAAAGLRPGPTIDPAQAALLDPPDRADVLCLANRVISMFFAFERPDGRSGGDRTFYESLFAARTQRATSVAYEIAAWTGAVIGRLRGTGHLPELPWMAPRFQTVPTMTTAGWYPNPYLMGEILAGEASWQRYWDGDDWTDQIRLRVLTGWRYETKSLFEAPPN